MLSWYTKIILEILILFMISMKTPFQQIVNFQHLQLLHYSLETHDIKFKFKYLSIILLYANLAFINKYFYAFTFFNVTPLILILKYFEEIMWRRTLRKNECYRKKPFINNSIKHKILVLIGARQITQRVVKGKPKKISINWWSTFLNFRQSLCLMI